jgi:hypothetical protein
MDPLQFFEKHIDLWIKDANKLASNDFKTEIKAGSGPTGGSITFFISGFLDKKQVTPLAHLKRLFNTKSNPVMEQLKETFEEIEPERIWIPRAPFQINDNPLLYAFTIYINYKQDDI